MNEFETILPKSELIKKIRDTVIYHLITNVIYSEGKYKREVEGFADLAEGGGRNHSRSIKE